MNSFGAGRGVAVAALAPGAGAEAGGATALGAGAGAGADGAGAGAAADAAVVAGRFAQPVIISPASSSDINVTCAARVTMAPPLASALNARYSATNAITAGAATTRDLWIRRRPS